MPFYEHNVFLQCTSLHGYFHNKCDHEIELKYYNIAGSLTEKCLVGKNLLYLANYRSEPKLKYYLRVLANKSLFGKIAVIYMSMYI